jgi:putative DNA primase/helicase
MRILKRQKLLDALTRKYLTEPKAEENGQQQDPRTSALSDEEVIALCRKARNAAKFADLFDAGDTAAYDGDDSSADLALVGILAFYTQDEDQLDRLFSRSALYRPEKWGKRSDYRRLTLDKALDGLTETYTPPRDRSK